MTSTLAPPSERIVVSVLDIDLVKMLAHVRDKSGGLIKASFRLTGDAFSPIPAPGEHWTALRQGYQWEIETRLDPSDLTLAAFSPGDTRVLTPGVFYAEGSTASINGLPYGPTASQTFTTLGGELLFHLDGQPISASSVQVLLNGSLVDPRTLTVNGNNVTLGTSATAGTITIFYQRMSYIYADQATVRGVGVVPTNNLDSGTATGTGVPITTYEQQVFNYVEPPPSVVIGVTGISAIETLDAVESNTVVGIAVPSAVENSARVDAGTAAGVAVVSATDTAAFVDAATTIGVAAPSSTDFAADVETGTAIGVAAPSATDFLNHDDAGTVIGVTYIATDTGLYGSGTYGGNVYGNPMPEWRTSDDAGTVIGVAVVVPSDIIAAVDAGTPTGIAVPSATDTAIWIDANTSTGIAAPSANDTAIFVDANTAIGIGNPTAAEVMSDLDTNTVVGVGKPSAVETTDYVEVSTSIGTAVPSANDIAAYVDANTAIGIAVPITNEAYTAGSLEPMQFLAEFDFEPGDLDASGNLVEPFAFLWDESEDDLQNTP